MSSSNLRERLRYPGIVGPAVHRPEPRPSQPLPAAHQPAQPASELRIAPSIRKMTMEAIPLNRMFIPVEYQQTHRPTWSKKIANEFDPRKLTPLTLADRGDGRYAIVDGQHRYRALIRLNGGDSALLVWCNVGLFASIQDEAEWFLSMNRDTIKSNGTTSFNARVHAGDEAAARIADVVKRHGFVVHTGPGHAGPRALTPPALERIERTFTATPNILNSTLSTLSKIVLGDDLIPASFVIGLGSFIATYHDHPNYREARIVDAIRKTTTGTIAKNAIALRDLARSSQTTAGRKSILMVYNHKLRPENVLPDL